MKPIIQGFILLCCFYLQTNIKAQTSPYPTTPSTAASPSTFDYELLVETPVYECDILGTKTNDTFYVAPKGAVFTVIGASGSNTIIRFWHWEGDSYRIKKFNYKNSKTKERKFFLINTADISSNRVLPRYSMNMTFSDIVVSNVPFKIRFTPDFETAGDYSLGATFGVKFRISPYKNYFVSVLGGINLTSVFVDSLDTGGVVRSGVETLGALTPAVGVAFNFNNAQLGVFMGWDLINGHRKEHWIYQGEPWISIGIGIGLNATSTSTTPTTIGRVNIQPNGAQGTPPPTVN